jgi:glyoxylate/hydroxypyruvate reductase A
MRIIVCCTNTDPEPWLKGLTAALRGVPGGVEVEDWRPGAAPADYAVVWGPPQRMLDEQPVLKALFNTGAGVDRLLGLRLPPHLPVIRVEDAGMGVQMAEYVCQALIRHFRDLPAYETSVQEGEWRYLEPRRREDFPVGVMGLGVLGQRVAHAVAHFGFPVLGWSRTPRQVEGVCCHSGTEGLDAFLDGTRVLVNLLPLTPATRDILDRRTLARLRPGAYLINVARGEHLVEEDLLDLIEAGHVAGATLDVFRTEPLPADHPFRHHPKITLTPHTSARTLREESLAQIAGKILALERGEPVSGVVDRRRGY